jgi:hypothetical protein
VGLDRERSIVEKHSNDMRNTKDDNMQSKQQNVIEKLLIREVREIGKNLKNINLNFEKLLKMLERRGV